MGSLEFILVLCVLALVLIWYLQNAEEGANGELGFLALTRDPEILNPRKKAYRTKQRLARRAHEIRDANAVKSAEKTAPAFRVMSEKERMRRKFRRQDEARYLTKDKAASYRQRAGPRDKPTA